MTELLTHVVDAYLVSSVSLAAVRKMVRVKGVLETWSLIFFSIVADSSHLIRSFDLRFTSYLAFGRHNFDVDVIFELESISFWLQELCQVWLFQ